MPAPARIAVIALQVTAKTGKSKQQRKLGRLPG
jgi:hypothetical protein